MVYGSAPAGVQAQTAPAQTPATEPAASQTANPPSNGPTLGQTSDSLQTDAAPRRTWFVQPRISIGETFTDNVNPGSGFKQADQITEVTPGIRAQADTARLKAYADYQLTGYYYARGSYGSRTQNALNAFGTFEALEKRFYLDFSGNISQQSISAFGPQVASNAILDTNRTEVSTYRLSPYLRGRIGSEADYELRYANTWNSSRSSLVSRYTMGEWSAKIKNSIAKAKLGWSLDLNRQDIDYSAGSKSTSERLRGLVSYQFWPDIKASVSAGQESNDYLTTGRQTQATSGYGLDWTPTERTLVSAFREKRFFGQGHNYLISHRTPLMALRYVDSKEVSFLPNQMTTVGRGTVYDLLYTQLESAVPDPILRAQQVSNLLAATGISPSSQVTSGLMTSRVTVSTRQDFSIVFNGLRNTVTASATRNVQNILGAALGTGDFSQTSSIVQKGLSVTWAHRLTPLASLTTTASVQETRSSGGTVGGTRTKSLGINYSTPIGAHTSLSAGIRGSEFTSSAQSYRENAVLASIYARF
jgi:uncharacterized protein (PEP-CTERM system associated)